MGKVSWMDKRTNEQVLSFMNEKRSLIKTIWDRKKNWIGHVVRRKETKGKAKNGHDR